MRPAQRSYMQTLRCDATLEGLWQALVRPAAVRLWHADQAAIDPRVGGRYAYRSRLFGLRQARIDTFEPGRRLRLVYDPNPSWPAAGDDPIVEDFLLGIRRNGTRKPQGELRLIGTGVPADPAWNVVLRRLQAGWAVAFSHLERRLESREIERIAS
jgi:uncharacterized protein YndB with AHSA1/START domain